MPIGDKLFSWTEKEAEKRKRQRKEKRKRKRKRKRRKDTRYLEKRKKIR